MQRKRLTILLSAGLLGLGACGGDFSDEQFGVLNLASKDGTSILPKEPPEQIGPEVGFIDGERAEYYDFGAVPTLRDAKTGAPTVAHVQPMYFFFAPLGQPLFSKPVREARDGADWMLGGRGVLNPNPKDFCAGVADAGPGSPCAKLNADEKKKPYPLRRRDLLLDGDRGMSADYQRPIVDVSPEDVTARNPAYTGLWEIVEVTAPQGYKPDMIKHAKTLQDAIDSGKFKARPTGKVINCPIVDERTYVPRGVTTRPIFRPRIEIWYRRQLAFCYLANGWETLGNDGGQLLWSNTDDERVDTFDVARLVLGEGDAQQTRLAVPVSKLVIPAIYTGDPSGGRPSIVRLPDNILSKGRPRHFRNDPPGYSPIRWMWDLRVYPDSEYQFYKSMEDIDPTITQAQSPRLTKNFPLRGVAVACSLPKHPPKVINGRKIEQCGNEKPDPNDPVRMIIDSKGDPQCTAIGLECNRNTCFCDAPFVGYGQACGPGIAQCSQDKDDYSDFGSTCFPPWGGYCYRRCKGKNGLAKENEGKDNPTGYLDSRCGGLVGYRCFGYIDGGVCLKYCDPNISDPKNANRPDPAQCTAEAKVTKMGVEETKNIGEGQTCQDYGLQICAWPDNYESKQ